MILIIIFILDIVMFGALEIFNPVCFAIIGAIASVILSKEIAISSCITVVFSIPISAFILGAGRHDYLLQILGLLITRIIIQLIWGTIFKLSNK